ncbi:hypothetical protein BMS3Abin03_00021 [bacterium BMS3Abin03]|nr:hypothetical protein BMS3Abin03_00021 [bacterium BMS3Abin03]
MGKPFSKEIEKIYDTFKWAINLDIKEISDAIYEDIDKPLYIIGSGGSLSACYYGASLYQKNGFMSKAITPLELFYAKEAISKSKLLFISAGGNNSDILFGFKQVIESEPKRIITLCMSENTALTALAKKYSICTPFEFNLPTGKDGFLATNSLVGFFTILYKVFSQKIIKNLNYPTPSFFKRLQLFLNRVDASTTYNVLYAGCGQSVAIDIESKFTEAALGSVLISDYRNFGHGRHNWLAKRGKNSAIIAIVTPFDAGLAKKTLDTLPEQVPKLIIKSGYKSSFASIDLLLKAFLLINQLGSAQNIDPGKPKVSHFGRILYNLRYSNIIRENDFLGLSHKVKLAIQRKTGIRSLSMLSKSELEFWKYKYYEFVNKLRKAKFGAVILDYDGTICSTKNRYTGLSKQLSQELIKIVRAGFTLGIATGRGQSVRNVLQQTIPSDYFKNVMIGYYNGSDISTLNDNSHPVKTKTPDESLIKLKKILESKMNPSTSFRIELRPAQLTVIIANKGNWNTVRFIVLNTFAQYAENNLGLVESGHSIDIIVKPFTSKLNLVFACSDLNNQKGLANTCLCIGDQGQWPGNDFELLSTPFSLSVDKVSLDPESCWNLAPLGQRKEQACLEYLKLIKTIHSTNFTLKI